MHTRVTSVLFQEIIELKTNIERGLEGNVLKVTHD